MCARAYLHGKSESRIKAREKDLGGVKHTFCNRLACKCAMNLSPAGSYPLEELVDSNNDWNIPTGRGLTAKFDQWDGPGLENHLYARHFVRANADA